MKKVITTLIITTIACISAFAEYVAIALPKESELNDNRKFYDASIAVNKIDDNTQQQAVETLLSTPSSELSKLLTNPQNATRASKFLKFSRLDKSVKIFPFNFGKWKVAIFQIPQNSRMRKGLNYFVFEQIGNKLLWDVSVNNMYLSLISQCNFQAPTQIDISKVKTSSASDKAILNDLTKNKQPFLVFLNGALISTTSDSNVYKHPASKFYKKIQDVFFSWQIEKYAQFMSPKSKSKFNEQYSGMSEQQKKSTLSDYFAWKKKYIKVLQLSDNEFIVLFKRQKQRQKDQFDLAYITLTSKDGSTGYLEKFGDRTPLDIMLHRHILR